VALRKMLVQFSELIFFVALGCQICAALAEAQPAQPPLLMSSTVLRLHKSQTEGWRLQKAKDVCTFIARNLALSYVGRYGDKSPKYTLGCSAQGSVTC